MRLRGAPYPFCRSAIVNLKGEGGVFRGVLWERRNGFLVVRNAVLLRGRGEETPLDGELVVPEGNVAFIQVVGVGR
jgi:hypothetical protein